MENFNSKKFRTEIHSLYLPGRRTVLPLLVLFGKDTFFKFCFAFDLHSVWDWFCRVLALNDVFWFAEVDPFWYSGFGGERWCLRDKVGDELLFDEYSDEYGGGFWSCLWQCLTVCDDDLWWWPKVWAILVWTIWVLVWDDGCDEVILLVLSVCLFVCWPGMSNGDDGDFGGSKLIVTSLWYGFRSTLFLDNILPFWEITVYDLSWTLSTMTPGDHWFLTAL